MSHLLFHVLVPKSTFLSPPEGLNAHLQDAQREKEKQQEDGA